MVTANALNSQTNDIARLIGAALGGVLAAFGRLALFLRSPTCSLSLRLSLC
jgi:hypothetical protein